MARFLFKRCETLLLSSLLCVVILLATGVSSVQMPSVKASTQTNAQAPTLLAKKGNPVAIVYHLCHFVKATKTKAASCPRLGNRFFVHNGIALANLTANEPAAKIGHVSTWGNSSIPEKKDTWFICSLIRVIRFAEKQPGTAGQPCKKEADSIYWVRDRTLGMYQSTFTFLTQTFTISKVPIAYKVGNDTQAHDGVFVCYMPTGSTSCLRTIPASFTGTLFFEHYVNPKAKAQGLEGRQAKNPEDFMLVPNASAHGSIRIVHLRTLFSAELH